MRRMEERSKQGQTTKQSNTAHPRQSLFLTKMKGTKVQTLGASAVAWQLGNDYLMYNIIMTMGAIINAHAH